MNVQFTTKDLGAVLLFSVDVRLFSAYRKVKSEDIKKAKGVDLRPDDVLTLGSQRVFSKEALNIFNRFRERMHRVCQKYGIPFLGGYAIPDSRADEASAELDKIVAEAMAEKTKLLGNYDALLDDFCAKHVEWEPQIRAKAFSPAYIEDRMRFTYHAVQVSAARDSGPMASGLEQQVGGLLGELLHDIATAATDMQKESLAARDKVTRKALRPLKAARDKIDGFTFLDHRLQAVVQMIDQVVGAMPADGPIEGTDLAMLWSITGMLADPGMVMNVAATYQPSDADAFLASLRPAPLVVVDAQPAMPDTPAVAQNYFADMPVFAVAHNEPIGDYEGLFAPVPEAEPAQPPDAVPEDPPYAGLFGGV